jgi:hypothetical protein
MALRHYKFVKPTGKGTLMRRFVRYCAIAAAFHVAIVPGPSHAEILLPPAEGNAPWLNAHCMPLLANLARGWKDVAGWRVVYVWKSDYSYLWDMENGGDPLLGGHYCTRVQLVDKANRLIESSTFLCSVTNQGKPAEVWLFGNQSVAAKLCPADAQQLGKMDKMTPLAAGFSALPKEGTAPSAGEAR